MFWRRKPAGSEDAGEGGSGEPSVRREPSRPPVPGTKIRLFLQPPERVARLLEVDLPDDASDAAVRLRCFEPPPDAGARPADAPTRSWAVELTAEEVQEIRERASAIRLLPLGGQSTDGDGATVELTVSAGPAEARLTWWMAPPSGWIAAAHLVRDLRRLSGEEL